MYFILTNQSKDLALEYTLRPYTYFDVTNPGQAEPFQIGKCSTKAVCPPLSSVAVNFDIVDCALPPVTLGDWMLEIDFTLVGYTG